jgi:hypothetical protein
VAQPQVIITIYEKCKMMLLRVPAYEILVGLERSVNAEDYNIADKIERLLSDTVVKSQQ